MLDEELSDSDFIVNCTVIGYENHVKVGEQYLYSEPFTPLGPLPDEGFKNDNVQSRREWLMKNKKELKLNYASTLSLLDGLKSTSLIMDVVYQPERTILLNMASMFGYKVLSGKRMNLLQAAYGFEKAFADQRISLNNISSIMKKV